MNEQAVSYTQISDVPQEAWQKLSSQKFFFGHQSVGKNIIDGVNDITSTNAHIKLHIVESDNPRDIEKGTLLHARVGANLDPIKKFEDFAAIMEKGFGNHVDKAFVKLCYLDIHKDTRVEQVFEAYKNTIDRLQKKNPETTFVHFTCPLTVSKTTWKTKLKKLIGKRDLWEFSDNIKRNQYNTLLRNHYVGKQPVFDIAALESTKPDGTRSLFQMDGISYEYLSQEYSYDGGHLNEYGRKHVAEKLLLLMLNPH
jgi:hypothetical protein